MAHRVTLADVARAAGVSVATASRAVNGSKSRTVRPDLHDRVMAAAAELGYTPDANAQAMARGHTTSLGLVVHDISDPYFAAIAAGVTQAADRHGFLVSLADARSSPERELEIVELLDRQRVVAIILAGTRLGDGADERALSTALEGYRSRGGRVASLAQSIGDLPVLEIDNAGGAAALARRIVALGYRDVAIVDGPADHRTGRTRTDAMREELSRLGHPVGDGRFARGMLTYAGGREAAARLLVQDSTPDVIMAATDLMAIGALAAIADAGLRAPDDVAVTGFDDIDIASFVTPQLTTVALPLGEIGERLTDLALDPTAASTEAVRGTVVVRESTPDRRRASTIDA